MTSLAQNVRMLTKPHVAYSNTGKIGTAQPLLTQLTRAESGTGKPTTNDKPIPIHLTAVAQWQDMEKEARDHQYERTGDDSGSLWVITASWEKVDDDEWTPFLEHVTLEWITQITNIIDPPRPRRPLMQPCAACGVKYTSGEDGKRIPAVTAWVWEHDDHDRTAKVDKWDVHCSACGAEWHGKEVAKSYWRPVEQSA